MIMTFFYRLWNGDIESQPPSFPTSPPRTPAVLRRRLEDEARMKHEREVDETDRRKAAERDEGLFLALLTADLDRAAHRRLLDALSDARAVLVRAYARALDEEAVALAGLENARQGGIVLADGRRVYFTRDGSRLYGEDGALITDAGSVGEANGQRAARPSATTYEELARWRDVYRQGFENRERLEEALQSLDRIEHRLTQGTVGNGDVAAAQQELADLLASLPSDIREDYARIQAARCGDRPVTYREADEASIAAPLLASEFQKAAAAISEPDETPSPDQKRAPLYRAVPEF